MERILLVEPNYKNKYPPIGLMKIATYFKKKGDFVEFHKGILPQTEVSSFDKIFITTLFTFDFAVCIQTIKYYIAIVGKDRVYVGGIAATIMPEKFLESIPNLNILTGQLISSNLIGYKDDINIDVLELDYDILWDIAYDYPASNSYFIYTSRGCPRKCSFCAVKILEPNFYDCDNICEQISRVDEQYGSKKNLLIMDNNILYSDIFNSTVDKLVALGFGKNNNKAKKCNDMKYYLRSLKERIKSTRKTKCLLDRIKKELLGVKYSRISKKNAQKLRDISDDLDKVSDDILIGRILDNYDYLVDFFDGYNYHTVSRFVDFNQGLDARLFTDQKAKKMAELAIKPCRIAFDNLKTKDEYFTAMENAVKHGITSFSNYLLYNYDEKPESLWIRLDLNVQFCKKHSDKGISLFSFPMKYASIEHTDRNYVGKEWHRKYLRAINIVLNATSGVVPKEEDFFYRAYGKSVSDFMEILMMPDDFIRFRDFFEERGFTQAWKKQYAGLSNAQKDILVDVLDKMVDSPEVLESPYETEIDEILKFYSIKKSKVEKNELFYKKMLDKMK